MNVMHIYMYLSSSEYYTCQIGVRIMDRNITAQVHEAADVPVRLFIIIMQI